MSAEGRLWRGLATMVAALVAAGVAAPTGRALGRWIILRGGTPTGGLAPAWIGVGGLLIMLAAVGLAASVARRPLLIAFCLVLLGATGLGAWQAVAKGTEDYRAGPLNAAL